MSNEKWNLELSEYIKQGEPEKKRKSKNMGNCYWSSRCRWFKTFRIFIRYC